MIGRDAAELARRAAEQFAGRAAGAIARAGRFAVALSGGSRPRAHPFRGDGRCVPPDYPDSNFRMAQETLLPKIQIPPENIHRMVI